MNLKSSVVGKNKLKKLLVIIQFSVIILIFNTIIITPSANGYEFSIYGAYPQYFWFFIILSIFLGQIIMFSKIFCSPNRTGKKYWILGFSGILMINSTLVLLPYIRGYAVYGRGDVLTHIGFIKDILNTGNFGNNFYPFFHIFATSMYYTSGVDVNYIIMGVIPPIFIFFYFIFIYVLGRELFKKKSELILVSMFSSILFFESRFYTFRPSTLSFVFLPLVLWSYIKIRKSSYSPTRSLLLIILFIIPFSHPSTFLFTVTTFLLLWFSIAGENIIKKNYKKSCLTTKIINKKLFLKRFLYTIVIISLFVIWYFSFSNFRIIFNRYIESIFKKGSQFQHQYVQVIKYANPRLSDILEVIINRYGNIILLTIIVIFFTLYFLITKSKNIWKQKLNFHWLFYISGVFSFVTLSVIVFFVTGLEWWRIYKYTIFFSTCLVGLYFSLVINRFRIHNTKKIVMVITTFLVIFVLLFFSIFSLYFSPRTKTINMQVSYEELDGMKWFFNYRDDKIFIEEIGISQKRFYDAIYGTKVEYKNIRYGSIYTTPPHHFGYSSNDLSLFGQYYSGYGDVNMDGIINLEDYRLVNAYVTGHPDWDTYPDGKIDGLDLLFVLLHLGENGTPHWIRADVNWDGNVSIYDAVLLCQHLGESYDNSWDAIKNSTPLSEYKFTRLASVSGGVKTGNLYKVTSRDAELIKEFAIGMIKSFPVKLSLRYLLICKLGKDFYPIFYPRYRDYWKFTPTDFHKLEEDRTVLRIYDDGDFDTYFIIGNNPKIG